MFNCRGPTSSGYSDCVRVVRPLAALIGRRGGRACPLSADSMEVDKTSTGRFEHGSPSRSGTYMKAAGLDSRHPARPRPAFTTVYGPLCERPGVLAHLRPLVLLRVRDPDGDPGAGDVGNRRSPIQAPLSAALEALDPLRGAVPVLFPGNLHGYPSFRRRPPPRGWVGRPDRRPVWRCHLTRRSAS